MRKFYLFVLSLVFTTLSVFAQFTNKPEVKSAFDPNGTVWVKVMFLNGEYPDNQYFLTDNTGGNGGFKVQKEIAGDDETQLFQLIGTDLSAFQLVSKKGNYLYAKNTPWGLSVEAGPTPQQGDYNLKFLAPKKTEKRGFDGIATRVLSFVGLNKMIAVQSSLMWDDSYVNVEDSNDGVVAVFKVVGADPPPSDPAPEEEPQETTYNLTKVTNGSGTFKICKRGTTEEIADLTKVTENTEIDVICEPADGFVLKQINDGTQDYLDASSFDPATGFSTTYSGLPAVTKNATITVTFVEKVVVKQKFMLLRSYGSEPAGGTFKVYNLADNQEIPEGAKVEEGTTVYVKAIPEEGYVLKQVNIFGTSVSQGDLFQESNFDPKTGFALTVHGINPINQNTRITVTFVKKEEEEQPEEEITTPEGFTNAPYVASEFDANAKTWYKVYFVHKDNPNDFKLLTAEGNVIKALNENADDDNQLWQLVGTDRNDFQLVSKSGVYVYSKMGTYGYELNGTSTAKKDQYQLKLIKPEKTVLQAYKGAPTKLLKFIDRDYYDLIYPYYDNVAGDGGYAELSSAGYGYGSVVVFKQIGENPEPAEMVSVTIQCEASQGSVTIEGVTEAPVVVGNDNMWSLEAGKEYTLNVVAKKGWEFSHIYDNRYANLEEKTFTASKENPRVEVHFKEKKYPIALYKKYEGGSVSVNNAYIEQLPLGYTVNLTVTPDAGYELESLTVRGQDISQTKSFDIDEDNEILAVFKKKTTGTVHSFTGTGGSVTLEGHNDGDEVKLGEEVTLVVTPTEGYELATLKVGGNDVKASKKFTVAEDNTLEVVFQKKTYSLAVPSVTGGKLTLKDVADGTKVEFGTAVTIEVTPDTGYELATLTAGGLDIKVSKVLVVGENNEIQASFKKKMYELTLPTNANGTLEFEGLGEENKAEFGSEVMIKVMPKKGYELASLVVGGKDVTAEKKFVVGEDNTIVVKFTEKLYTLVVPQTNGGSIQFLGIEEGAKLKMGTKVRVKVTPEKGYVLAKLTAGGQDITADRILTIGENNDVVAVFRKANALDEIDGFSFAVYPNPATDYVVLEGLPVNAKVQILDLTGKLVLTAEADFIGALRVNVSHLPKGLYLVRSGKAVVKLQVR